MQRSCDCEPAWHRRKVLLIGGWFADFGAERQHGCVRHLGPSTQFSLWSVLPARLALVLDLAQPSPPSAGGVWLEAMGAMGSEAMWTTGWFSLPATVLLVLAVRASSRPAHIAPIV